MFTRSTLSTLLDADPPLGVSVFLPTSVRGTEIRQGPIRLGNLIATAREKLAAAGRPAAEVDAFLAPAAELVEDYPFWQHQSRGLALFLDGAGERHYRVPITLDEQVIVGPGFHVRALLPLLSGDGAFLVLTLTTDTVRLYRGSRFALTEDATAAVTRSLAEVPGEPGYENPVQASPAARPHTGTANIGNAQVYGDSPPEWRKAQLLKFVRRVAADVDAMQAADPLPVVVAAGAELAGHFRQASSLGPQLVGTVQVNPEALDEAQLHQAVYPIVSPLLDANRRSAVERVTTLLGQGDRRAAIDIGDVVKAAYRGQVDTLLCHDEATAWGRYDAATDDVVLDSSNADLGQDLLEAAAVQTLGNSGTVHVLTEQDMPQSLPVAAVLRY